MKKLTALLLAVALVLSSMFTLGMTAAAGGAFLEIKKVNTIVGDSVANKPVSFTVDNDSVLFYDYETYTIKWRLNAEGHTIKSLKWEFKYSSKDIQIVKAEMPQLTGVGQIDHSTAGVIKCTASKADGFTLKADEDFITIEIKMIGSGAILDDVTITLTELTYSMQSPLNVTVNTSTSAISPENMPKAFSFAGTTPTDYNAGNSFTLNWLIDTNNKWLDSLEWSLSYDSEFLQLDKVNEPKITLDKWESTSSSGVVSASMNKAGGFLPTNSAIISVSFKALKKGSTSVDLSLDDLTYTKIYTVKFITNGGTPINDLSVRDYQKAPRPQAPRKEGYKFVNWYEDKALSVEYTFTPVRSNVTLYAKWEPIVYKAYFVARNKLVKAVDFTIESTSIEEPQVPERKGFAGKWPDYTLSIGNTTIIAEYTMTAKPVVTINNYKPDRTVIYHQTQEYTVSVEDRPEDTVVRWFVDGKEVFTSAPEEYIANLVTDDYEIQAKLIDNDNGQVLAESPVARVHVINNWLVRMIVTTIESIMSLLFHLSLPGFAVYYGVKHFFGF